MNASQKSRTKETGSTVIGGATIGIIGIGVDEATHCGINNEEVSGTILGTPID
jgi:hypothetical protein